MEYITFGVNGKGRVLAEGVVKVSDRVRLKHVALVKLLGFNFLSVSQLLDEGFKVSFKRGASRILDSRCDLVCLIVPEGLVFRADFSHAFGLARCLAANSSSELWRWHRRLGDLSFDLLPRLSVLGLIRRLPRLKFEKDLVCAPCRHGKMVASSHPLSPR